MKTGRRTTIRRKKTSTGSRVLRKTKAREKTGETFLFECTRQGCGYRIVREEKVEQGRLRFDLKCPKCHNREFKCLGPGDLPAAETMTLSTTPVLDLDNVSPAELGSN